MATKKETAQFFEQSLFYIQDENFIFRLLLLFRVLLQVFLPQL